MLYTDKTCKRIIVHKYTVFDVNSNIVMYFIWIIIHNVYIIIIAMNIYEKGRISLDLGAAWRPSVLLGTWQSLRVVHSLVPHPAQY